MGYWTDKLEKWFKKEKEEGKLVDLKFFGDPFAQEEERKRKTSDEGMEKTAKAVYETITGKRKEIDMTHKTF